MRTPLMLVCALLLVPVTASAQSTSLLDEDRYHIVELANGVLRIDRQTGDVSECRESSAGLICRLAADDRAAYEAEINRLTEELASARAALEVAPEGLSVVPDSRSDDVRERMGLPDSEELDAVMDTAEEAMRRFVAMVQNLRDEIEAERGQ